MSLQGLEHGHAPYPQHHLLFHPVGLIAAVQKVGDIPVSWVVHRQIGIQQQDGHTAIGSRTQHMQPAAHPPLAILQIQGHGGLQPRCVAGGISFSIAISMEK